MKPREKVAEARTPNGSEMLLFRHDGQYSIRVDGCELMNSRQHESELELARKGCAFLTGLRAPTLLIGGLGLGYTLRQALDMVSPQAQVVVSELLAPVADWNREFIGKLNGYPLKDERVELRVGDVVKLISRSRSRFDAILMDIDNGPGALTDSENQRLYERQGIHACRRALRSRGCLAFWSAGPSKRFERLLASCNFRVQVYRASPHPGSKSQNRFIWVASEDPAKLPPE